MTISPAQVKAARRLLGWSQDVLGGKVGLSKTSVALFEKGGRRPAALNVTVIRKVLESAGVEFTAGEAGVRLAKEP
jgi:transcriptional regulator with XRE-family HTH domain